MGFFASLIVCVLSRKNGEFAAQTRVTTFKDKTYVSWESGNLPETNWVARGTKSIYFKKGGMTRSEFEYDQHSLVTPVRIGLLGKTIEYQFSASYIPSGAGVFHLILPEMYIPETTTFKPRKPQHIKTLGKRLALTWTFGHGIGVKFMFKEASENELTHFQSVGVPIKMKLSPKFKEALKKDLRTIKDEGEEFAAKVVAEFFRPPGGHD